MEGLVTLNKREQKRLLVLNHVEKGFILKVHPEGKMRGGEAEVILGVSLRHVRRLLAGQRKEGAPALAHGNRGRKPSNTLGFKLRKQVIELARSTPGRCP